jgi:hypothetical protein
MQVVEKADAGVDRAADVDAADADAIAATTIVRPAEANRMPQALAMQDHPKAKVTRETMRNRSSGPSERLHLSAVSIYRRQATNRQANRVT